jgi:hypothetical protein
MAKLTLSKKVRNAFGKEVAEFSKFYNHAMNVMDRADTDEKALKALDRLMNDQYFYGRNLYVKLGNLLFENSPLKRTSKGK